MNENKLVRSQSDRMCCGVAAGLAEYVNLDPVIVRLIFVLLTLSGGPGLIIYIVLAIIMPEGDVPVAKVNSFDEEEIVIKES